MCGIIGMRSDGEPVSAYLYAGLNALQHRGKESAGIATADNSVMRCEKGAGEIPQIFSQDSWKYLPGNIGVGNVRYSTSGASFGKNVQPIRGEFKGFEFYLVHNGNILNLNYLRSKTRSFSEASDTQIIADFISASSAASFEEALLETAHILVGSFNLLLIFNNKLYVLKDRFGLRPLQIGTLKDFIIIASESCVFSQLKAQFVRDVEPGEFIVIDENGANSTYIFSEQERSLKFDIFEFIYFLRPDSIVHGIEAGKARQIIGQFLATLYPIAADIIVSIPDSGNEAAEGYHEAMLEMGWRSKFKNDALFRPHTTGRTFIAPVQSLREDALRIKFIPRPEYFEDKFVLLVDDSIVRGNTMKHVVELVKGAGARSVSACIASPLYLYPDFYGIDTYRVKSEIIAKNYNGDINAIKEKLGLAGLYYLDIENVIQAVLKARYPKRPSSLSADNFYTGPFTGIYPAGTGDFSI